MKIIDRSCWSVCLRLDSGWIESWCNSGFFFCMSQLGKNVGWTFLGGGKSWPNKWILKYDRFRIHCFSVLLQFNWATKLQQVAYFFICAYHWATSFLIGNFTPMKHLLTQQFNHHSLYSYGNWEVQILRVVSFFSRILKGGGVQGEGVTGEP